LAVVSGAGLGAAGRGGSARGVAAFETACTGSTTIVRDGCDRLMSPRVRPSGSVEPTFIAGCARPATLEVMDDLQNIAAIAIAFGAALVFALMAWAGQHRS
jgi:hypothetical protein